MVVKFFHKQLVVGLALVCSVCGAYAQDVSFSQPYSTPLYLNPAYSGVEKFSRIGASFRYQWAQLGDPYTSYSFYADHYFSDYKSGVGFSAVSDRQAGGGVVQSNFGASYAYNLHVAEKTFIRFGIQALLGMTSTNAEKLVFSDMLGLNGGVVASEPYASEQRVYFDMALGSVFSYDFLFAGVALHHLRGSPSVDLLGQSITVPRKLTLHGGCNIPVGSSGSQTSARYRSTPVELLTISPSVIFCWQGIYKSYSVGSYAHAKGFSVGFFYKSDFGSSSNFFSTCAGYTSDLLSLMYSFDFGVLSSETKAYNPNTHEVSLIFKIKSRNGNAYRQEGSRSNEGWNMPIL